MKRLILVLVVLLLAAACDSSTPPNEHWRKSSGQQFLVYVVVTPTHATTKFVRGIDHGIAQWDAHPDIRMARASECPEGANCVFARRDSSEANAFAVVWGDGTHLFTGPLGDPTRVVFNSTWENDAALINNAACHELGHTLDLGHSPSGHQGPCVDGVATSVDNDNVDAGYNQCHLDAGGPRGSTQPSPAPEPCASSSALVDEPDTTRHVFRDTKARIEA
jgi:hypothetical protein